MYNHTAKITLNNGVKCEITLPMPTSPEEWADVVLGDGDVALSRINELCVRSFVIARATGARKCRTEQAATSYMKGYVFGEKGSPQPIAVDVALEWTEAQLAHFKVVGIDVA